MAKNFFFWHFLKIKIFFSAQECERKLTETEDKWKMEMQDKIEGMKKLLDRESQRCQDMVNGAPPQSAKNEENAESNESVESLKSIISRQNTIIDEMRLKMQKLNGELL